MTDPFAVGTLPYHVVSLENEDDLEKVLNHWYYNYYDLDTLETEYTQYILIFKKKAE